MVNGPDFSGVTSREQAEALARDGVLEPIQLLPLAFGGHDVPENVVYIPRGMGEVKDRIDENLVRPLVEDGTVTRYVVEPAYDGDSFVPVSLTIRASDPGSFTTVIKLWGSALQK